MRRVMGQMTLTTTEKIRLANNFNLLAKRQKLNFRVSLFSSEKHAPQEVIQKKGRGPLGS